MTGKGTIMTNYRVTVFKPYPFTVGQKIRIEGSRRHGDWEVVATGEHKVTLRCPISRKEYEWDWFCYAVEKKESIPWPQE